MPNSTKQTLVNSFKTLLNEQPFKKITISDITDACGVNRMTFYYHFHDIYDLIEWSFRDTGDFIKSRRAGEPLRVTILNLLDSVKANQEYVLNIHRSLGNEYVMGFLDRALDDAVMNFVGSKADGLEVSESEARFIADFYKYAFIGIILRWIQSGMKESTSALVDRIGIIMKGNVDLIVKNFGKEAQKNEN